MIERYFGLIEAVFVFGLALAFYLWQRHTLKRDMREREERERTNKAAGSSATTRHPER